MTPEQIDAATNAAVNVHAWLDQRGPYLFAAATGAAGWWAIPRITRRRTTRRGIRQLENYANHPAHRSPRKEKP